MPQGKEGTLPTHGAKTLPSVVVDSYTKRWSLCTTMRWCKAERTAVSHRPQALDDTHHAGEPSKACWFSALADDGDVGLQSEHCIELAMQRHTAIPGNETHERPRFAKAARISPAEKDLQAKELRDRSAPDILPSGTCWLCLRITDLQGRPSVG
jgi:hypothetical protein